MTLATLTVQRCLTRIKQELKRQGITYTMLAERMNLSVVTVTRMLNQDDITLTRLLRLAEICGLDGLELIDSATVTHGTHYFFSDRQDAAFADNPHLYAYFVALFFEQQSPKEIAEAHGLSELSTYRYLRALENLELIAVAPGNQVKFVVRAPLGFRANSRVLRQSITQALTDTSARLLNDKRESLDFMLLKPLHLPEHAARKLQDELRQVIDKYAEASELLFADAPSCQVAVAMHATDAEPSPSIIPLDSC
ncbi:MAG: helix-turn-helix transcriptional regulator [Aliidiomarina sp.]|uniref:helix-turn-helix domain-containing protein n=1 Tax=Aliidiomarina sp. TaxID=1872439 RepID=UPI0025C06F50|nr:helix-turn-helix transcriptional regulator [Aliidiomarina sp.]MCH8500763.1 helix-turn-helix transcriptional regulator [Aliidiomarina sp.]